MKRFHLVLFSLLWLCGCAASAAQPPASSAAPASRAAPHPRGSPASFPPAWIIYPSDEEGEGIPMEQWIREHPMPPDQEISIHDVSRGETSSSHIVQIRKAEGLHVHEYHDLIVVVQRGEGVLRIGSRDMRVAPGSVFSIPRGVPHSFVNESDEPAVAFVVFTPAFDGKDTVPLPE